jgi:hypothetical protein|tara:strand:+ start:1303 stop:1575 length:273 start_codon:yes stop_codon:yes gene_type:complete
MAPFNVLGRKLDRNRRNQRFHPPPELPGWYFSFLHAVKKMDGAASRPVDTEPPFVGSPNPDAPFRDWKTCGVGWSVRAHRERLAEVKWSV